jgi:Protein of unknown function DUF2834
MSPLRWLWAALALWGAVHPWGWLAVWLRQGNGLGAALAMWRANAATMALTWDLVIAAVTLTVFALAETLVRRNWEALLAIPATWLIGPGCGLPLYLFLRAKPVR